MTFPDFSHELTHWHNGYYVVGTDEVGRGAFAGPLYVGAVIFPNNMQEDLIYEIKQNKINDSKLLSSNRRQTLAEFIKKIALSYHIAGISVEDINKIGVGRAGKIGMEYASRRAISKLKDAQAEFHILTDAFEIDRNEFPNQTPLVRGDRLSITIAAASILAKVARDQHMIELSTLYPGYEWEKNKGYGTLFHRKKLIESGPTPHHRYDFIQSTISSATY